MSYDIQTWEDLPSEDTPVNAERLNHMEAGIKDAHDEVVLKASKASGVSGTGLPWAAQAVWNSNPLIDGFNDLKGGLMADKDIVLESMVFWLEDVNATITGTAGTTLTIEWWAGSINAYEESLIQTTQVPVGGDSIWVILAVPQNFAVNTIFRPKAVLNGNAVAVPCHVQFRGRYQ